jgi:UDP-N-acetylglucosamine transferase subunit ALG13
MSGRILSAIPGVRLYAQYPEWARGRWHYGGSIYDGFEPGGERTPASRLRVAVAVGTMRFPFSRLVERIVDVLPADADVLVWQTGATQSPAGVDGRPTVPIEELRRAFRDADAVIAHAGIGTALDALDAGRMPILVPRLRRFGEHVDDHQLQVARELERRGLALARSAEDLTAQDLLAVARRQIVAAPAISPFALRP